VANARCDRCTTDKKQCSLKGRGGPRIIDVAKWRAGQQLAGSAASARVENASSSKTKAVKNAGPADGTKARATSIKATSTRIRARPAAGHGPRTSSSDYDSSTTGASWFVPLTAEALKVAPLLDWVRNPDIKRLEDRVNSMKEDTRMSATVVRRFADVSVALSDGVRTQSDELEGTIVTGFEAVARVSDEAMHKVKVSVDGLLTKIKRVRL
jgi:hypothetical protein